MTGSKQKDTGKKSTGTSKDGDRKKGGEGKGNSQIDKPGNDYWDRVADDVASGYTSADDEDSLLNVDQEPGDNERGDVEEGKEEEK